jgi:galactokinase/mevalonate kinase-like predicted kinase
MNEESEILVSVPPAMALAFSDCEPHLAEDIHAFSDPESLPLGSGGGTAHVLARGWEKLSDPSTPFTQWLQASRKIIIHGGGQSRRLPSYAPAGKLFIPIPAFRWTRGHRVDQNLLELQRPLLEALASHADPISRVLIASGDVLLRTSGNALPPLPSADVVMLGLWTRPEEAQDFGVMFCDRQDPGRLICFEQKPTPDRIRELARDYLFMIDVGVWLLSEKAVRCLMRRSGMGDDGNPFDGGETSPYELYGSWALHLGDEAIEPDDEISDLSVSVVPIPEGEFYHFGTSRDVIRSLYRLQNLVVDQTRLGAQGVQPHPRQFVQNAVFDFPLRQEENHTLWIENSTISSDWSLASQHVLTGIPDNDWDIALDAGTCLDFVPIREDSFAIRFYGMDDPFRGPLGNPATLWLGKSACAWLEARGLAVSDVGDPDEDIQQARLFPILKREEISSEWIQWLVSSEPIQNEALRSQWLKAERESSAVLNSSANLQRLYAQRRSRLAQSLPRMAENAARSMFYKLDLANTAAIYASQELELPPAPSASQAEPLIEMHDRMFRAAVMRSKDEKQADALEAEAFTILRETVVGRVAQTPVTPSCQLLEDQIVWGRCPVRLDIAGGWTDTPPYCYEFGGRVVNVAVDMNGQPPIQVFARLSEKPELVIRSIDQGLEERISDYDGLEHYEHLASGFAVARAAFALSGFHPRFNGGQFSSLREQLEAFGGGIELSMLAAVPKGSGLGASSILSASILGTLADMSGLSWDHYEIMGRTTALEQLLTSGGGWQDQIGGLLYGAKLIETRPGLNQSPTIRWLPNRFFTNPENRASLLLYYTGVTRVAHSILGEIVRGIFLNSGKQLDIIRDLGRNADFAYDAIQQDDFHGFAEAIRRNWALNQALDSGTNVPEVQAVIDQCGSDLAACKLLGAGGGGYLLIVAHDPDAAQRLQTRLEQSPQNARARFVDFSISETGLQTTRS